MIFSNHRNISRIVERFSFIRGCSHNCQTTLKLLYIFTLISLSLYFPVSKLMRFIIKLDGAQNQRYS